MAAVSYGLINLIQKSMYAPFYKICKHKYCLENTLNLNYNRLSSVVK